MGAGSDEMARLWMMDGLVVWLVRQRRHEQRGEEANARWKSLPRTSRGAAAARERHLPLNLNHNHSTTHTTSCCCWLLLLFCLTLLQAN